MQLSNERLSIARLSLESVAETCPEPEAERTLRQLTAVSHSCVCARVRVSVNIMIMSKHVQALGISRIVKYNTLHSSSCVTH